LLNFPLLLIFLCSKEEYRSGSGNTRNGSGKIIGFKLGIRLLTCLLVESSSGVQVHNTTWENIHPWGAPRSRGLSRLSFHLERRVCHPISLLGVCCLEFGCHLSRLDVPGLCFHSSIARTVKNFFGPLVCLLSD
jgi:hypothetical protein